MAASIDRVKRRFSSLSLRIGLVFTIRDRYFLRFGMDDATSCWTTTFKIRRHKDTALDGKEDMKELSIETVSSASTDSVVLKAKGSITSTTTATLQTHLYELNHNAQYRIVLDLSECDFISSSGIALILVTLTSVQDKGGDLILMKLPKQIEHILDIINVKGRFTVIDDLDELKTASESDN